MSASESHFDVKRRILVADDEEAFAAATARILTRQADFECSTVHSVDEAIQAIKANPYDLVLTDMRMPGRDGIDLVREVSRRWPQLPVVVMTGHAQDFPYMSLVEEGVADFVIKPFDAEELAAKLLRIFRERDQIATLLEDIDRLKKLSVSRALSEQKYRSLFQYSMNGMVLLNPTDLTVEEVNEAFSRLLDAEAEAIEGTSLVERMSENDALRFRAALEHFRTTGQGTLADIAIATETGDTALTDVSMSFVTLESGTMLMLMFKDVTEQREMQRQISDMATKDSLTGLFNHRMLFVELDAAINRCRRDGTAYTLMYLDLDNFKSCNDTHGHQTGDALLKSVGEIILNSIRGERDRGFRYGGDEFGVLFGGIGADVAAKVAERIRQDFDHSDSYGTSMSIGIAPLMDGMDANEWLRSADEALYAAKNSGKNSVVVSEGTAVENS